MLVLSPGKARWARSVGAFDAETLGAFGNGVAAGRRATESIDAVPALQEVDCASVARGADAVAEDDALGDEIMAEILEEERREREAREAEAAAAAAAAAAGGGQDEGGVAKDEMSELQRMEAELEQCSAASAPEPAPSVPESGRRCRRRWSSAGWRTYSARRATRSSSRPSRSGASSRRSSQRSQRRRRRPRPRRRRRPRRARERVWRCCRPHRSADPQVVEPWSPGAGGSRRQPFSCL
mmetsp:Transcript_45290/g.145730  ORF Transcript_45290/g.145730 Transcript_45290/m.145730 type:complete len:239 (+) Transcript_45290:1300-2016(+)